MANACNSSLIFYAGQANVSSKIEPLMLFTVIIGLVIVAVSLTLFVSQKPYYDRLKVRPTFLIVLTSLGVTAQVASGPLPSISQVTYDSYPCWLRLLVMVLVPSLVGSSFMVRIMLFHFTSNLSRVALTHHRELLEGEESIQGFLATACSSMKTGIVSLFRPVEANRETMLALKFLTSMTGQLIITCVVIFPYLLLVVAVVVIVPEYRQGCAGCKLFPNVFMAFTIAMFGFAFQCALLYCMVRHESDYWGLGRELYYVLIFMLIAGIGFLLSFLVANEFQVLQTIGFAFVIVPQAVYPVYLARKFEGRRRVRKSTIVDLQLLPLPDSEREGGSKATNRKSTKVTLKQVMENAELFAAFEKHLTAELAVESLLFLKDATHWRETYDSDPNRTTAAKRLCRTYVQTGSVLEINVSHKMRAELEKAIMQVEPGTDVPQTTFDTAIKDITFLVQTGPLLRFASSPAFTREFGDKYTLY